jgi:NAD(P)-dependent dehydrogenase (short-subunit alcohol dehydrogenase family)
VVAIETADHGITCNAICPGWVMTPLVAQQVQGRANAAGRSFEVAEQEFVAEKQPMARYTLPIPAQIGGTAACRWCRRANFSGRCNTGCQ